MREAYSVCDASAGQELNVQRGRCYLKGKVTTAGSPAGMNSTVPEAGNNRIIQAVGILPWRVAYI
jgi:hypothetical protein